MLCFGDILKLLFTLNWYVDYHPTCFLNQVIETIGRFLLFSFGQAVSESMFYDGIFYQSLVKQN